MHRWGQGHRQQRDGQRRGLVNATHRNAHSFNPVGVCTAAVEAGLPFQQRLASNGFGRQTHLSASPPVIPSPQHCERRGGLALISALRPPAMMKPGRSLTPSLKLEFREARSRRYEGVDWGSAAALKTSSMRACSSGSNHQVYEESSFRNLPAAQATASPEPFDAQNKFCSRLALLAEDVEHAMDIRNMPELPITLSIAEDLAPTKEATHSSPLASDAVASAVPRRAMREDITAGAET
eukprot:TRINITY_DN41015_c0_g1_i1.p1 TRINITY_DN41015_c0_g1~~TRINITY_DN41015_c0_g1_i1.p1  ORF type:complete len:238 (+),score=26.86 TRINITY_DN41015_c0_g1_i1:160-873(+)